MEPSVGHKHTGPIQSTIWGITPATNMKQHRERSEKTWSSSAHTEREREREREFLLMFLIVIFKFLNTYYREKNLYYVICGH